MENLQNHSFVHPPVAEGFKFSIFRARGGSIWFQWGGAEAPSMKSTQHHPRHDPIHLRHTLRRGQRTAQPSSMHASQFQRRDPSAISSSNFEHPLAEDPQVAAEAAHAGKTLKSIGNQQHAPKVERFGATFKNPFTEVQEIHMESTRKSRRRARTTAWLAKKH